MDEIRIAGVAGAFVILFAITLAEMRRWLPAGGRAKAVIVFLAGAAIIGSLRVAGLPPIWFAGGEAAFGIVGSLALGALVNIGATERRFGLPLLLGMSLTLGVLNVMVHV